MKTQGVEIFENAGLRFLWYRGYTTYSTVLYYSTIVEEEQCEPPIDGHRLLEKCTPAKFLFLSLGNAWTKRPKPGKIVYK